MELIHYYFPDLTKQQIDLLAAYKSLLTEWNQKINLISRKNVDQIEEHHILHSLSIAKLIRFQPNANVLDLGTGGGLPGIPLSIVFPETEFYLVDSIHKKIKVVLDIKDQLGLDNINAKHTRVEAVTKKFDFVVTRAVAHSTKLIDWTKHLFSDTENHDFHNGIFALKGGDLEEELAPINNDYDLVPISTFYEEAFFETKKIVYYPMTTLS